MKLNPGFLILAAALLAVGCGDDPKTENQNKKPADAVIVLPNLDVVAIEVSGSPARRLTEIELTVQISTDAITSPTYVWAVSEGWTVSGDATGSTITVIAPDEYSVEGSASVEVAVAVTEGTEVRVTATTTFETRAYQVPDVSGATVSPDLIVETANLNGDPDGVNDYDVTYTWTIGGLEVATDVEATWTNPGLPGVYEASVVAVDSEGAVSTKDFVLNVGSLSAWPTAGRTLQHSGRQDQGSVVPVGDLRWTYLGPGVQNSMIIGADGTIFAGSWDNYGGGISAITPAGAKEWSYDVTAGLHGSLDNYGAPVVSHDGYVYATPWHGNLTKINAATGALVWEYYTGTNFDNESPKIGADGTIYTSTELGVIAVRPNGTLKWYSNMGTSYSNNIAIGQDGTIYALDNDSSDAVIALEPVQGHVLWSYPITGGLQYGSIAVNSKGKVVVADNLGWVTQIKRNGTLDWAVNRGTGCNKGVALGADDTIFYVDDNGVLNAVKTDGTERWTLDIGSGGSSTPSIGADGTIYAADSTSMTAVRSNGTAKWQLNLGANSESQPAISGDGIVYFGLNDSVVAIE